MADIETSLLRMGLMQPGQTCSVLPLSGGVSCDAYRVEAGGRVYCVKRALGKLRVKADWFAPAGRSVAEAKWMRLACRIASGHAPVVAGEDPENNVFAMQFFPPETFPVWKGLLAAGTATAEFAAATGRVLARLHAATAGDEKIKDGFANGEQFYALRVDAYLLYTSGRHSDVAPTIRAMAGRLAKARIALMHGDFSPKNILCGPDLCPVILDAETCCYGDPAFDLAFCLNHFLLKAVWHPEYVKLYADSFAAMRKAYLMGVDWEAPDGLEARAAGFLSAFLLARVDGKSPVEYITDEAKKSFVRETALGFLRALPPRLADISATWFSALPR